MSTHNIGFYEDLTKITLNYHQISSNTHISSAVPTPVLLTEPTYYHTLRKCCQLQSLSARIEILDNDSHFSLCYWLKSKMHAPNLHACIIYIRVNILPVCIFAHANANTHGS